MKTTIRYINYLGFVLALCAMVIFGCRCSTSKPTPDPLAGFRVSDLQNLDSNKVILDDYKDYIRTLSPEEQRDAGPILFYEDGTGQHAVEIMIGINNRVWEHVLIYDKHDKRIRTVKYSKGGYQS
jgi:hypothetical protein